MNYTIPTLRACALTAIPGCYFAYGEKDEANIALVYLATILLYGGHSYHYFAFACASAELRRTRNRRWSCHGSWQIPETV
jgi:hypothetical protein